MDETQGAELVVRGVSARGRARGISKFVGAEAGDDALGGLNSYHRQALPT